MVRGIAVLTYGAPRFLNPYVISETLHDRIDILPKREFPPEDGNGLLMKGLADESERASCSARFFRSSCPVSFIEDDFKNFWYFEAVMHRVRGRWSSVVNQSRSMNHCSPQLTCNLPVIFRMLDLGINFEGSRQSQITESARFDGISHNAFERL